MYLRYLLLLPVKSRLSTGAAFRLIETAIP
jgi:hypothetical protein